MRLFALVVAALALSFCTPRDVPAAPTAVEILGNARTAQGGDHTAIVVLRDLI